MKMMSNSWLAFVIGLLFGFVLGFGTILFIFFVFLIGEYHSEFLEHMFAPIFAGLIAFISVLFALFGVQWNIWNQNNLENQRVERRLAAARASLPVALNELANICKRHVLQITNQKEYSTKEAMIMSEYAQEKIKDVIENSDGTIITNLSNLLTYYQIAKSKYELLVYDRETFRDKKLSGQMEGLEKIEEPEKIERPDQRKRLEQKKKSAQKKKSVQKEEFDQTEILNQKKIQLIILWISLKALAECYLIYRRSEKLEINHDKVLVSFKKDLKPHIRIDHEKISEYLKKESVEGCGFLDPNYLENNESDK